MRLLCATRELIEPRDEAVSELFKVSMGNQHFSCFHFKAKEGKLDKNNEPFGVRAKQFWDVSHAKWVLESFMKDLSHENDGLIFSPATDVRYTLRFLSLLFMIFIHTAIPAWKVQ